MFNNKRNSPGDLVVCQSKKAGLNAKPTPVFIPEEDRFLHTLILGPVGCGKTHKSLLPMIKQDIDNPNWGVTVMETDGDLALDTFLLAKEADRSAVLFDPTYKNCPKFNPLAGDEMDVVEYLAATFRLINPDSPQVFLDLNEQLLRNAVKVLKRLDASEGVDGKYATLLSLDRLIQNTEGRGRDWVLQFSGIASASDREAAENRDIANWFLNEYFSEGSKTYENTPGIRSQVSKLVSNAYLRDVLNPDFEKGEHSELDFRAAIANKDIVCISIPRRTLRDLSRYVSLLMIQCFHTAVCRQNRGAVPQQPHSLYIDELAGFAYPNFSDLLIGGRKLRLSVNMTAQSRRLLVGDSGMDYRNLVEAISANARNVILHAGICKNDMSYYSAQLENYGDARSFWQKISVNVPSQMEIEEACEWNSETPGKVVCSLVKGGAIFPPEIGYVSRLPENTQELLRGKARGYREKFLLR